EGLAATADRMRATRGYLAQQSETLARACLTWSDCGAVEIATEAYRNAHQELRHRVLGAMLRHVGRQDYPPRREQLIALETRVLGQAAATLHGCEVRPKAGKIVVTREFAACPPSVGISTGRWDGWVFDQLPSTTKVGALGEAGLLQCPDWRASGYPRRALLATPAAWNCDELIAAPLAGLGPDWHCCLEEGEKDFYDALAMR
ncbi:MAG TPA: hypothetical protein VLA51_10155, partial [Paracoccaceae bacterium]|nr:hypothetical protein [Paracoccaceae bacterium]